MAVWFCGYFHRNPPYRRFQKGHVTQATHSDRRAIVCQGRHSCGRPPFLPPCGKSFPRQSLPPLLPPLTSRFPSAELCQVYDVPVVPIRSLTGSWVPLCHMNQQSLKFIWSLVACSHSSMTFCETWSKSTLLSGCVLPECEMRLLCSKELC